MREEEREEDGERGGEGKREVEGDGEKGREGKGAGV